MSKSQNCGRATWRQRLRYRFDNYMARGAVGQILLLGGASAFFFIIIVSTSVLLHQMVFGRPESKTLAEIVARTFMLILVPDPVDLGDGTLTYFSALLAIVAGLFVGGTLIGILSSAIDDRMDQLRRGRSFVAEENHTVILGWSSKIFRIVSEIVIANENHPGLCIAILADHDPVDMEQQLRERVGDYRGTNVVCRRGKPIATQDMELVNLNAARAVIVLSPEERKDPDSHIIKILLTSAKIVSEREEPLPFVVELMDRRNQEICKIAVRGKQINVVTILPEVLIPRLLVQSCRKRGLSNVYLELFDFDGDEIYFHSLKEFPSLIGKTFSEAVYSFDTSSIIGVVNREGQVDINPDFDLVLNEDDEILSISEDDDTTIISNISDYKVREEFIVAPADAKEPQAEKNLILGCNRFLAPVIRELDDYVHPGSKLTIAAQVGDDIDEMKKAWAHIKNHDVDIIQGATGDRRFLETIAFDKFDNILILPHNPERSDEHEDIDATTIKTLVYVRDIAFRNDFDLSITTEMLLEESRAVADLGELGDFVVGDEIIGRIIAQLAEEFRLKEVFRILLTVEGSEIYLRPASNYVHMDKEINGYTLLESAKRRKEICIGYIKDNEIRVNAQKSKTVSLSENDKIIVVAEH